MCVMLRVGACHEDGSLVSSLYSLPRKNKWIKNRNEKERDRILPALWRSPWRQRSRSEILPTSNAGIERVDSAIKSCRIVAQRNKDVPINNNPINYCRGESGASLP